jgi:hypothetical protein
MMGLNRYGMDRQDNSNDTHPCPLCHKVTPHASKVVDIPVWFRVFYCENCKTIFYWGTGK